MKARISFALRSTSDDLVSCFNFSSSSSILSWWNKWPLNQTYTKKQTVFMSKKSLQFYRKLDFLFVNWSAHCKWHLPMRRAWRPLKVNCRKIPTMSEAKMTSHTRSNLWTETQIPSNIKEDLVIGMEKSTRSLRDRVCEKPVNPTSALPLAISSIIKFQLLHIYTWINS